MGKDVSERLVQAVERMLQGRPYTVIAGHLSTAIAQAQSRAQQAREERLATLGRFLSSMLHDLKTPLTVISGYTHMLVQEGDENARREAAASIRRQVQLLKTMMGETLAFAKGERRILIRRVYLHSFFEDVAEQLRPELAEKGIRLELILSVNSRSLIQATLS